jgi:hypothetical protein
MSKARKARQMAVLKEREDAWDLSSTSEKLPDYNPLFDENLRHYFENRRVQKHLFKSGLIDREGRVIDLQKAQSKLHIIEREFAKAEAEEELRQKEELEMRKRVQKKRHEALEKARRVEAMVKLKEDRRIRREIVRLGRGETVEYDSPGTAPSTAGGGGGGGGETFFMTGVDYAT